jgi:hypothetical protein
MRSIRRIEEMARLKELYAKKDEIKKKELLKAVENSGKSYEEILEFLTEGANR